MNSRTELLEVALESLPEGIALLDEQVHVVLWNRAAVSVTGFAYPEVTAKPLPEALDPLLHCRARTENQAVDSDHERGVLTHIRHRMGHEMPVIVRIMELCDHSNAQIGTAIVFHSTGSLEALPTGECCENEENAVCPVEFQKRLSVEFDDFIHGGLPLGVIWILVDQAVELRKTHGTNACREMLEKLERALAQGLRPSERLGRWGDDEFLVIAYEHTAEMLAARAQALADAARMAEFHWWGDRVPLTVSIGAAQAEKDKTLVNLLERAKAAMIESSQAGGDRVTQSPGGQLCLPS